MMRSTLGAPFGGTMRGGHQGVESLALCLMTLPYLGGGAGSCLPSSVVVALGEPGAAPLCWAPAQGARDSPRTARDAAPLRPSDHFIHDLLLLPNEKRHLPLEAQRIQADGAEIVREGLS